MNRSMLCVALGCAVVGLSTGCQSDASSRDQKENAAMTASSAEADRATLARFVGVWTFEGWTKGSDGVQHAANGHGAGAIEKGHFVLLEVQTTAGEFGGRTGERSGSMLFASEPGIGVTLTAWGDSSASVSRLVGTVNNSGVFAFNEVTTPGDRPRASLVITFESNDRWIAEIRDVTAARTPMTARYQFTRKAN